MIKFNEEEQKLLDIVTQCRQELSLAKKNYDDCQFHLDLAQINVDNYGDDSHA